MFFKLNILRLGQKHNSWKEPENFGVLLKKRIYTLHKNIFLINNHHSITNILNPNHGHILSQFIFSF
jgi:hypothetical protein